MPIASAASSRLSALCQRIEAQPSGEMTEYTLYWSISSRSQTPIASAPPEPPSPITTLMIGVGERRHLEEIARDGLALAALLGADARIRARRVDEGDERQAETLGHLHEAQRLAIALGLRHAVVAAHPLLGVAALLVADQHHGSPVEARRSADDGEVVRVHAIAVQLLEVAEDEPDVIERVRPLRVARELRDLPG